MWVKNVRSDEVLDGNSRQRAVVLGPSHPGQQRPFCVFFVSLGPLGGPFSASNSRKAPWPGYLPPKTPLFMLPCSTSAPREKGSVLAPSLPKQPIKRGRFERTVSKQRHRDLGCITRQQALEARIFDRTYYVIYALVLLQKQSLNDDNDDKN